MLTLEPRKLESGFNVSWINAELFWLRIQLIHLGDLSALEDRVDTLWVVDAE